MSRSAGQSYELRPRSATVDYSDAQWAFTPSSNQSTDTSAHSGIITSPAGEQFVLVSPAPAARGAKGDTTENTGADSDAEEEVRLSPELTRSWGFADSALLRRRAPPEAERGAHFR
ncbi:hypothetical protein A4X03_0g7975, partial [Tilletia caries]